MWDVISGLAASGVTIFLTTQYLDEADRLADHIAVVDGGRIVAQGTANELKRQVSGHRLDIQLADPQTFAGAQAFLGRRAIHLDHAALTIGVATDGGAADVRALLDRAGSGPRQHHRLRRARSKPRRRLPVAHVQA